jgi:hypothetical protein
MSSEERYEHIEDKIIEAAKNTQVGFEEASWVKMEALLDKDKKRRRFVWLWLLLIPILFGVYELYKTSNKTKIPIAQKIDKSNKNTSTENNNQINTTTVKEETKPTLVINELSKPSDTAGVKINPVKKNTKATNKQLYNNSNNNKVENNNKINTTTTNDIAKNNIAKNKLSKQLYIDVSKTNSAKNKKILIRSKNETVVKEEINAKRKKKSTQKSATNIKIKNGDATENEVTSKINRDSIQNNIVLKKDTSLKNSTALKKEVIKETDTLKKDSNNISTTKKVIPQKKNTILSRFYLLAATGVDNGSVKLLSFSNSTFVPRYGFGIGFDINKKMRVQAGIYVSTKKYTAAGNDYTAKEGSILSRFIITKADAACKIYEIPISFGYTFLQKKSYKLYASAGISSYIMKEEFYNISYLRNNIEYSRPYTYTGNQHLFSTALLSVGIEKKLSNRIALQVEPIIGIPLKAVGEGSVKLFSTSLQLGVQYHPFRK